MNPNLTPAEINHLRRLLGWVRCEYGQEPAAYAEQAKEMIAKLESAGFKTSDDAKAYIAESYMHKASTPKYVRAAVKALEKLLVKQDGVVVDVAPSAHPTAVAGALSARRLSIGGMLATAGLIENVGWSETAPNEPGRYLFRCAESDYKPEEIIVTLDQRNDVELLIVDCPHLGMIALPHFHSGLTGPSWKRLENER